MVSAAVITLGFTDDLTGYRYDDQVLADRFQGPSRDHILGTDFVGRDTLSRIIYGSRVSITIGFLAVAISQGMASIIGIVSGYYGGKVDAFMQRLGDIGQAMPGVVAYLRNSCSVSSRQCSYRDHRPARTNDNRACRRHSQPGGMLNNSREYVTHPWLAIWPGLALTLTVFAFNIVGDALRDIWDPRLRGSR
jgi:ABC-type dipeptide/oligopeptide/nickel transport system permease subunit